MRCRVSSGAPDLEFGVFSTASTTFLLTALGKSAYEASRSSRLSRRSRELEA